ncbi:MAG: bifunctional phosphopantothenoylcysteine decarboxylase/phosphopantothenate--cysteine ligase CoaBC [Pseudomonadota bacterium]
MCSGELQGKRILLGVTGGIAAYKAVEVLRRLREHGAVVRVAMTRAATAFVGPLSFEALSGLPVLLDVLALQPSADGRSPIGHVELARDLDLVVVAPATADFMARTVHGRADDPLAAILLATRAPVLIAPAMEHHMWWHDATQANLRGLLARGIYTVGPARGSLASGASGDGRMAEPEAIVEAVSEILARGRDLEGRRVVITAGPTREPVDPVRFLSNRSSGRMGVAVALEAARRGARVVLVHGPLTVAIPQQLQAVSVETAEQMHAATFDAARGADVVIMAAAVADYAPAQVADHKLSKQEQPLERIELVRTPDILAELCARRPARVVVGFAAETQDVTARGQAKRARKGADLLVANLVGSADSGFDVDTSRGAIIFGDGTAREFGPVSKHDVARLLVDAIVHTLASHDETGAGESA